MKVFGNRGLGAILKVMLQISLVLGVILLLAFPYILHLVHEKWNIFWTIIIPCGLLCLVIIYEFTLMFKSLEEDNPFNEKNVIRLKVTMWSAFGLAVLFLIEALLAGFIYTERNVYFISFLSILFLGISIALHILKELFGKAITYKEENELTI